MSRMPLPALLVILSVSISVARAEANEGHPDFLGSINSVTVGYGLRVTEAPALFFTWRHQLTVTAGEDEEWCEDRLHDVREVDGADEDGADAEVFNYVLRRERTVRDEGCNGALTGGGLLPAFSDRDSPLRGANSRDTLGYSRLFMRHAVSLRPALAATYLDLAPDDPRVEEYRLTVKSSDGRELTEVRVIFDQRENFCAIGREHSRPIPLFSESRFVELAPSNSLMLVDAGCDGMIDFAELDFQTLNLGFDGYLLERRWLQQNLLYTGFYLDFMVWIGELEQGISSQ